MVGLKAILLCAGKSSRIAPVAKGLPKPLLQVDGVSILERTIGWLARSGIRDLWINLHYQPHAIPDALGDGSHLGVDIRYCWEPHLLGTSGAVKVIAHDFDAPFLVVYGDNLYRFSLENFYSFHKERGTMASLALFDRIRQPYSGIGAGQVGFKEGRIHQFLEGNLLPVSPYINAGAYLLEPEFLHWIPEGVSDFAKDVFPPFIAQQQPLTGYLLDGYCLGLDTLETYQKTLQILQQGIDV